MEHVQTKNYYGARNADFFLDCVTAVLSCTSARGDTKKGAKRARTSRQYIRNVFQASWLDSFYSPPKLHYYKASEALKPQQHPT